jgi:hypothetical protein
MSEQFGFRELIPQSSRFDETRDLREQATIEDSDTRKRISALEERMEECADEIAALQNELFSYLSCHESTVEGLVDRVARLETELLTLNADNVSARTSPRLAPGNLPNLIVPTHPRIMRPVSGSAQCSLSSFRSIRSIMMGFCDCSAFSDDLCDVRLKASFKSVARQPPWFRCLRLLQPV